MASAKTIVVVSPETLERTGRRIAPDDLEHELLRRSFAVWDALRGHRRFPPREAVTPRAFVKMLDSVALIRFLPIAADFEFRIVGHAYQFAHGFTLQGKTTAEIDTISPGYGTALKRIFSRVCRKGEPVALRGAFNRSEKDAPLLRHESLFLPLGPEDNTVDHIFGIGVFAET